MANTDIFGDDPNGIFLFEAFSLLDDQADDLNDLIDEADDLLSISYSYEKE